MSTSFGAVPTNVGPSSYTPSNTPLSGGGPPMLGNWLGTGATDASIYPQSGPSLTSGNNPLFNYPGGPSNGALPTATPTINPGVIGGPSGFSGAGLDIYGGFVPTALGTGIGNQPPSYTLNTSQPSPTGGFGTFGGGLTLSGFGPNSPSTTASPVTGTGSPTALGGNFNVGPGGTTQVPFGNSFSTIPTIGSALNSWWKGITGTNTGSLGAQGLNSPQAIADEAVNQANQYYTESGIKADPATLANVRSQALAMAQAQFGNVAASQWDPSTYRAGGGPTLAQQAGIWAGPQGTQLSGVSNNSGPLPAFPTGFGPGGPGLPPSPLTNTSPYIPPTGTAPSFTPPTYKPGTNTGVPAAPTPTQTSEAPPPTSTALSGGTAAAPTAANPNNQTAQTNNQQLTGNSLLDLFILSQLFGGGGSFGGNSTQGYGVQQTPLGYTQYAPQSQNNLAAYLALLLGGGINPRQGNSGGAIGV